MTRNLLPIGRFSKVTQLSVKSLRHYADIGLLVPAIVDPQSGYRFYSAAQATEGQVIRQLRALDMPLEDIRSVLRERDADAGRRRLAAHRVRISEELDRHQRILAFVDRLLEEGDGLMTYEVQVRGQEAQPYMALRLMTTQKTIGREAGEGFGKLFQFLGSKGVAITGVPFARYHGEEFDPEAVDAELCLPVAETLSGNGEIVPGTLPPGEVAVTLHAGPYEEISLAYQALGTWIQEHGHETAGPPQEMYLAGPPQVTDPTDYRTEVAWPIQK
jgi:effector-binding domain-containing protein